MPTVAHASLTTPHSAIREIGALAATRADAIRLEIGDPAFVTAPHVIEAAAEAATLGFTRYTPSAGLPSLREQLVAKLARVNAIDCSPDEVIVTTGGCGAIFAALLVLLDPGDEVLIPDPGWPNYRAMVHMLNARPLPYRLRRDRLFEPDFESLEQQITPRTKVLLTNSPGNPTGSVFSRRVTEELARVAAKHDLWLISDECYDQIVFEGEHVSASAYTDPERLVSVFSFSKTYAMTGWRVGYLVAQPDLASSIAKTQESVVLNCASVSQKAAEAALSGPQDHLESMRRFYQDRRDVAVALLEAEGIPHVRPRGAFYLMVELPAGVESHSFALALFQRTAVAVVPGTGFGAAGEGTVRVSLSVAPDQLEEGIRRLSKTIHELEADPAEVLAAAGRHRAANR